MDIEVAYADLTVEDVDAVVNAANSGLYAGSGVCGALHDAAGHELDRACMRVKGVPVDARTGEELSEEEAEAKRDEARSKIAELKARGVRKIRVRKPVFTRRCPEGECVVTPGFRLPASHVIHAVGPVWSGGRRGEVDALDAVHRSIVRTADEIGAETVSIPAISTGVFGFPLDLAARTAVRALREAGADSGVRLLRIAVIDEKNHRAFSEALAAEHVEETVEETEGPTV